MAIWDSLFGNKNSLGAAQGAGASEAISKTQVIEVHVLDPKGNYSTTWDIGKDVPAEIVQQAKDPDSGALYALTSYEKGQPKTHVCKKEHWLAVKAQFDAIEQEGADVMAQTRKKYPDLFR